MKDQYKTTARHFEIFKKEAEKWIKRFGLLDWEHYFFHEEKKLINYYLNWDIVKSIKLIY